MEVSKVNAPPVPPKQAAKPTQAVQQAAEQAERNQANAAKGKAQASKPAPVVNTQGQQTGRLLNVVA